MGVCPCAGTANVNDDQVLTNPDCLKRMIQRDLDQIFNKMDVNKDGNLDRREVEKLLQALKAKGVMLAAKNAEEVMKQADNDHDGKLNQSEFRDWIQKDCLTKRNNLIQVLDNKDRPWLDVLCDRALKSSDKDGNGMIDLDELTVFLAEVSKQIGEEPPSREEVAKILAINDKNKDNMLSKSEFRQVVKGAVVKLYFYAGNNPGF